jgi:ABC-type glycerol-3-phosphate transport system substrate-binding protein
VLVALILAAVTGCAGQPGRLTLTFWTWVPGIEKSVDLWHSQNPDVQVQLESITAGVQSWQSIVDRQPILYQLVIGGALVSVVPLAIAIIVLQRFWRIGLTQGSVKA